MAQRLGAELGAATVNSAPRVAGKPPSVATPGQKIGCGLGHGSEIIRIALLVEDT